MSSQKVRKRIPDRVKLEAALRRFGLTIKEVEFDHSPALALRPINPLTGDTIPPANDPDHIDMLLTQEHRVKTFGRGERSGLPPPMETSERSRRSAGSPSSKRRTASALSRRPPDRNSPTQEQMAKPPTWETQNNSEGYIRMTMFRIHTRSSGTFDVEAKDPNHARKIFLAENEKMIITKIKVVKG